MRYVGRLAALWTVAALLSACAAGEASRTLRGQAGRVTWEIVDIEQALEDRGLLMRWSFTIPTAPTRFCDIFFTASRTVTSPSTTTGG